MNDIDEQELFNEFSAESRDHLESIEPDLLALERDGAQVSQDIINRVFRAVHSLKGSAGFFGFTALAELSHAMESVFMMFRDGEILPDPAKIDALLAGADKLRVMVDDVAASNDVPYKKELERINAILKEKDQPPQVKDEDHVDDGGHVDESQDPSTEPEVIVETYDHDTFTVKVKGASELGYAVFEIKEDQLLSVFSCGSVTPYAVWIDPARDFDDKGRTLKEFLTELETFGQCFGSDLGDTADEKVRQKKPGCLHLLFGTILRGRLVSEALGIPDERIKELDSALFDPAKAIKGQPPKRLQPEQDRSDPEPEPAPVTTAPKEAKTSSAETIRVSVELIDKLMNLAGELVLGRNQLRQELGKAAYQNPKLGSLIQDVDAVTSELQENIMQMRMQPVGNLFSKFTRVVRDLSRKLSKEAELVMNGKAVELDKSILEGLSDPMTHLIRNCMDHALEQPDERDKIAKPRCGLIQLDALHEGGQVNIMVADDGRGIDPDSLAENAVAKKVITADRAEKMTDREKLNLIFLPGFSTAKEISDVSGRGVGMDVVKTNIEKLGGHVEIDSVVGRGTTVRIRLPLTLAIIPSLIVGSGGRRFAIPQVSVQELVCVRANDASHRIENLGEAEVLSLRERLLPLVRLSEVLGIERRFINQNSGRCEKDRRMNLADRRQGKVGGETEPDHKKRLAAQDRRQSWHSDINVVVLRMGAQSFGLIVDELFDNEEIVVKPLSDHIKDCKCFAGATIMGDGRVAMILDPMGIARSANLRFTKIGEEEQRRKEEEAKRQKAALGKRQSILLFNNAPHEYFAIKLENISRLEKIDPLAVHRVGARDFIEYRGKGLPLIHLDRLLDVAPIPEGLSELFVIIPKTTGPLDAGIMASRILDTVEAEADIQQGTNTQRGLYGSAFIEGQLTLFLNPNELLNLFKDVPAAN